MKYDKQPNPEQLRAIEAPVEGSYRVLAPPGSGKSFQLSYRYAYLVEQGVDPNSIAMVCFNKSMADEMGRRVLEVCPEANLGQISTIHAFCYRNLPSNGRRVAKDWQVKRFLQEKAEDLWPVPDERPGWKEILGWINTSKSEGIVPQESGEFFVMSLGQYHGERVYRCNVDLANHLKGAKLITFADMLLMVDVLLERDTKYREEMQARYKWVLVDEGQDVSGQAMRILTTVAAPQDNFMIVGDDAQLMYRFTGATPEANLMDGFEQRFPGGELHKLAINYRSDCSVIYAAQKLVRNNYQPEGPYEERYMKDTAPRCGAQEGVEFTFTAHLDATEEAESVAENIALYLEEKEEDGLVVVGDPSSIFVGARTRAQLGYLEGPLVRSEVPFINIAGGSFWTSKHVADVVAYLRLAHDGNDAAFQRVYNIASNWMTVPWKKSDRYGEYCHHRFLGKAFMAAAGNRFDNVSSAARARYSWGPGAMDLTEFVTELQFRDDPGEAVQFVIEDCYTRYLQAEEGLTSGDEAENGKTEDLWTAQVLASEFETIPEFLAYVDECIQAAEDAKNGDWDDYVVISTIHRLKGLERDTVYGVGWGEGENITPAGITPAGLLPHTFSLTPPPQMGVLPTGGMSRVEDERCCAFVLVTRARHEVHLSYPRSYRNARFGPSRFAREMELVRDEDPPEVDQAIEEMFQAAEELKTDPTLKTDVKAIRFGDLEWKNEFAEHEAEQEREAFRQKERDRAEQWGNDDILSLFPHPGRFEGSIYRPSARELVEAMPGYEPAVKDKQLVLVNEVVPDSFVHVWTSVMIGQIAGGTAHDSIRVTRADVTDRGTFWYKNETEYVTRRITKECDTPEKAIKHLVGKIEGQVAQMVKECPECGAVAVKCKKQDGHWWKASCSHRMKGGDDVG